MTLYGPDCYTASNIASNSGYAEEMIPWNIVSGETPVTDAPTVFFSDGLMAMGPVRKFTISQMSAKATSNKLFNYNQNGGVFLINPSWDNDGFDIINARRIII